MSEVIIDKLVNEHDLSDEELLEVITSGRYDEELFREADKVRREYYGTDVYLRGLIEFTNICKNNCYYCGIRAGNEKAVRFRLSKEDILGCCRLGHELGYRTFVLQGGEDMHFDDDLMCDIIAGIHELFPEDAITLSIGEKSRESYQRYYDAGAQRFLLRHETADEDHYRMLHPASMSLANRKQCLFDLKEIGYQVGTGMMVGAPYQTAEHLVKDFRFMQTLQPDMIGIGPYITHKETPFADFPSGTAELTVRLIALFRLMFPYSLIPATTALGTIDPEQGRLKGLRAGANVMMPNLSPLETRKLYDLYENKLSIGSESATARDEITAWIREAGYNVAMVRGDVAAH